METKLPNKIASSMLDETKLNFEHEEYGNDGRHEKWSDRYTNYKGSFTNVEKYLRYKKLDYTGKLRKSIRKKATPQTATIGTDVAYAELHNTGKGYSPPGGNRMRMPPKSTVPLLLGRNPAKRQFMGFGERTEILIEMEYNELFKLL